jgi:hypothetical protein
MLVLKLYYSGRSGVFIAKLLCGWMRPRVYAAVPLLPASAIKGDPSRTRNEETVAVVADVSFWSGVFIAKLCTAG